MARRTRPRRRDIFPIGYEVGGEPPPTPPVLSAASAVDFCDIFVWGQATTDTASGTLYAVVVPQAAATPTAEQISESKNAAGTVITQSANVAVSASGVKRLLVRNLTAVTPYKICMTQMVAAVRLISSYSNVVTANFTTDTLIAATATNGSATGLSNFAGCGAFGTNQTDPYGTTNAVRWIDNGDTTTGAIILSASIGSYFNGNNKYHVSIKQQGGNAPWVRVYMQNTGVQPIANYNVVTGALGTETFTGTLAVFDHNGWKMFSGVSDLTHADVAGSVALAMCLTDNVTNTTVRNGTHIKDIYNFRITRV